MKSKAVYGVGTPLSIYDTEHGWVNRPIVFVDESAEDVWSLVKAPRYPLRIDNYSVSCANLKLSKAIACK